MIELYLSKVTETSETEAEHNTAFSEGLIVGVLTDFVKCVREMVLNGNTVKVGNLAIFKATVESNGLEVLYDAQNDKVAQATLGTLKEGDKTGAAVKTIKLLAQSTGDFTLPRGPRMAEPRMLAARVATPTRVVARAATRTWATAIKR